MGHYKLEVSYSQVAIFNSDLENPFNDWSEAHVNQGFSWREDSVSFRTLIESGGIDVEFMVADKFSPRAGCQRAISVPFRCYEKGNVEVATITEGHVEAILGGLYQIVFETGYDGAESWCRLTAIHGGDLEPKVLIADPDLSPRYPLLMASAPA